MSMSLFEEDVARGPRKVTLVRLAGEVARAAATIGRIVVEGEVHRVSSGQTGARWFSLRDRAAQVAVRVPASLRRARVVPGERVAITGRLEWSADRGQLTLTAEDVTPAGEGAVAAMIAEVRDRLAADGTLARPRRPIPVLPACVGVVCGQDAAVIKDIESVVASRFPGYPLHFERTLVSGPGAAPAICEALARAAASPGVEVVILARGGGDATSLLPWSSEEVCRAAAASPVAVVSAIGHDGDHPLVDEVADLRCGTPSIAAAAVVPDRAALVERCDRSLRAASGALADRCGRATARHGALRPATALRAGAERAAARLGRAGGRLELVHPRHRSIEASRRLASVGWRRPWWEHVGRVRGRLDADARHLASLAPDRVLERGFAVVRLPGGVVVRSVGQVGAGQELTVAVADGAFAAVAS